MSTTTKATTSASAQVVITSFPVVPLTTTFTPPADCSGFYAPSDDVFMVDPMTSCLPSGLRLASTAYFSPGVICPSGYVEACHDTKGVSTITTVTCCPVRGEVSLSCVDTASLAGVFSTLFCSWIAPSTTSIPVTLSSNGGTTSTSLVTFASPAGFNAYGVRMVYESSDLAALSTSTPKSNPASTTQSTTSTIPTTSSASPTGSASKGTSAGTIAAAVVVPLLVLALLGGLYFWWSRQRKRKTEYTSHELSSTPPKWYSASSELPPNEVKRNEMSDFREPAELPANGG
jgi:hypothetical protein